MVNFDDCPALFEEGLIEILEGGRQGVSSDLTDAFARALCRSEYHTVTLHVSGLGVCRLRLLGIQGDVLRAIHPETGALTLIPLRLAYAFYEGDLLPPAGEDAPVLCVNDMGLHACYGLTPELERLVGKHATLQMPHAHADLLITDVNGLALSAVSGSTMVHLRVDSIYSLELSTGIADSMIRPVE